MDFITQVLMWSAVGGGVNALLAYRMKPVPAFCVGFVVTLFSILGTILFVLWWWGGFR